MDLGWSTFLATMQYTVSDSPRDFEENFGFGSLNHRSLGPESILSAWMGFDQQVLYQFSAWASSTSCGLGFAEDECLGFNISWKKIPSS